MKATPEQEAKVKTLLARDEWIKAALAEIGLTESTVPEATLEIFKNASERMVPDVKARKTEIKDEDKPQAKAKAYNGPRRRRTTGKPVQVKNPNAEPTEKQLETIRSLHEQFDKNGFAKKRVEFQKQIADESFSIEGYAMLNRGEISKLLALYIPFAKANWGKRK